MGERQKDNKEKQNNINFKKRRKPHKNMHITMEQKIRLIRKKKMTIMKTHKASGLCLIF